jgi:diguanylate cyclase (GGDEF)-like protein
MVELICSMVISWFILGEALLPVRDDYFVILLLVQIVVILLSFTITFLIVLFLHRFLVLNSDNMLSNVMNKVEELTGNLENSNEALVQTKQQMLEAIDDANTDPLTGLFNRRYADLFFSEIHNVNDDSNYFISILDLDDFKRVNDTYGHQCGDQVLVYVSHFIRSRLRKSDIVFRWGGEEFLIILKHVDASTAYTIFEKLRLALSQSPIETNEVTLHVTVTIGFGKLDINDVSSSIKACDDYLYAGKKKGKNIVITDTVPMYV